MLDEADIINRCDIAFDESLFSLNDEAIVIGQIMLRILIRYDFDVFTKVPLYKHYFLNRRHTPATSRKSALTTLM